MGAHGCESSVAQKTPEISALTPFPATTNAKSPRFSARTKVVFCALYEGSHCA